MQYIRLHAPSDAHILAPHNASASTSSAASFNKLHNTSTVDIERPTAAYAALAYWECVLEPGEMLYIPPRWWHYVRALDASASVSFWWRAT